MATKKIPTIKVIVYLNFIFWKDVKQEKKIVVPEGLQPCAGFIPVFFNPAKATDLLPEASFRSITLQSMKGKIKLNKRVACFPEELAFFNDALNGNNDSAEEFRKVSEGFFPAYMEKDKAISDRYFPGCTFLTFEIPQSVALA